MNPSENKKLDRIPNFVARYFTCEIAGMTFWGKMNLDIVMDIGCGCGSVSTQWIDRYFPKIKRLIGIDKDQKAIALAKERNSKEKIEFHVADIMEKESLKKWEGRVHKIFSTFMLHEVEDQKKAFKNVFDLLQPTGNAALCFVLEGPYYFALLDLLKNPKWSPILEPLNIVFPEALKKDYVKADYEKMFEDVGFKVLYCEVTKWGFSYESDEECKNFLYSLQTIGDLTDGFIEEFKNALFDQFMTHSGRDEAGLPYHRPTVFYAILHKNYS